MPENTPEKCKKHLERISRKTLQIMPETNLRNHEASKKKRNFDQWGNWGQVKFSIETA